MDELAEQIVEHFPTEDKVFTKNKEILKGGNFFLKVYFKTRRNPGVIVMVATHAVALFTVFIIYGETWPNKPTTYPLQKLPLSLRSVRMKMMKRNL